MICLPKELTQKFLTGLKNGTINPDKLSEMSSEERRAFFKGIVGDSAKEVNALFESKLLLQDQRVGMTSWIKEVGGLKPEVKKDMLSTINKLDNVLSPEEERAFLQDLASKKLGTDVSLEEAKKITELAKKANETKSNIEKGGDRMAYGRAVVEMNNYINELKETNKPTISEIIKEQGIGKSAGRVGMTIAGTAKSLKATLDNSYIGHQGWKMMWSHPTIWFDNAVASFKNAAKVLGGKEVMDEIHADIISRENAINGSYKKMGLAIGTTEEAFPSAIAEKIPGVGRVLKAADVAYTAQAYTSRADAADLYLKIAKRDGVDITDAKQLKSMGKMINSLTGRGNIGRFEPIADTVNVAFFALRYLKSNYDTITGHTFQGDVTPFVRKQAALNLLKIVGGTMGVLATANALKPGSVEKDPRSADFGKIKVGNTRFDVSGGMGPLITLAMRLAPILVGKQPQSKSSVTGIVQPINATDKTGKPKFGATTGTDVLSNFFGNKVSPLIGLLTDFVNQHDRNGNKITLSSELSNFLEPLPIANIIELKQNDVKGALMLAGAILDALGIQANTYTKQQKKK